MATYVRSCITSLLSAGAIDSPVSAEDSIPILYSTPHDFATSPSSVPSINTSAVTVYLINAGMEQEDINILKEELGWLYIWIKFID